jgi:DNA adenine methylase
MVTKIMPYLVDIPHRHYVEPFGGGASIMLAKPPAPIETYNDLDSRLYELFKVLSDPVLYSEFERRVSLLPVSRQLYNEYRTEAKVAYAEGNVLEDCDIIERVIRWYYVAYQSFGGKWGGGYPFSVAESHAGMSSANSKWLKAVERLPAIHQRLQRVQIEHDTWQKILARYDTPDTLFYIDPPYVPTTWDSTQKFYHHNMTIEAHTALVEAILALKGHSVVSGYPNAIYEPLEAAGWQRIEFSVTTNVSGRTRASNLQGAGNVLANQQRTEVLWISDYQEELPLFKRLKDIE